MNKHFEEEGLAFRVAVPELKKPNPPTEEMYKYFESITHDWTEAQELYDDWQRSQMYPYCLTPPNPPTPEAIKRAQFVDKTYVWTGK